LTAVGTAAVEVVGKAATELAEAGAATAATEVDGEEEKDTDGATEWLRRP
jgi:hypothetical protein